MAYMHKTSSVSDSIVGSLCREIEYIKLRSSSINKSLNNCQNALLIKRLNRELNSLRDRLESIQKISTSMLYQDSNDHLSIRFLIEISKRNLIFN